MNWLIKDNVISKLIVNDEDIINPWGIETADSSSFFSLENNIGFRYAVINKNHIHDERNNKLSIEAKLKEGQIRLDIDEKIETNKIVIRNCNIKCLADSYFMDFVMRFRFKKKFIQYAQIAGKEFYHKNTNIYYQYPVDSVFLKGTGFDAKITIVDAETSDKMKVFMYVRDRGDEWIVHARMLPQVVDRYVIKLCSKWFQTRPLPQILTKMILKNEATKSKLLYRSERSPYVGKINRFFSPNAYPLVRLNEGQKLSWSVKVEIL